MHVSATLHGSARGANAKTSTLLAAVAYEQIVAEKLSKNAWRHLRAPFHDNVAACVKALNVAAIACLYPVLVRRGERLEALINEVEQCSTGLVFVTDVAGGQK